MVQCMNFGPLQSYILLPILDGKYFGSDIVSRMNSQRIGKDRGGKLGEAVRPITSKCQMSKISSSGYKNIRLCSISNFQIQTTKK